MALKLTLFILFSLTGNIESFHGLQPPVDVNGKPLTSLPWWTSPSPSTEIDKVTLREDLTPDELALSVEKIKEELFQQAKKIKLQEDVLAKNGITGLNTANDLDDPKTVSGLITNSATDTPPSDSTEEGTRGSESTENSSQSCSVASFCYLVFSVVVPIYTYALYRVQTVYVFRCKCCLPEN